MSRKVSMILSGCGVFDGTELHEAVITNLELHRKGFEVEFFAPDVEQAHVFDHLKGTNAPGETRNVLTEAARIARGKVKPLEDLNLTEYAGVAFPGGFGAAKNLSTYAFDGENCKVNEQVGRLIREAHGAKMPMLFMCISPMLPARVLGKGVELTIGSSPKQADHITQWGARHITKAVNEFHTDEENLIVSTPAYMCEAPIPEIAEGIAGAVGAFAEMMSVEKVAR